MSRLPYEDTRVSVSNTQGKIRELMQKYGAQSLGFKEGQMYYKTGEKYDGLTVDSRKQCGKLCYIPKKGCLGLLVFKGYKNAAYCGYDKKGDQHYKEGESYCSTLGTFRGV